MLLKEPTKHHAIHLAALRELCAKSPLKIMKEYSSTYKLPATNTSHNTSGHTAGNKKKNSKEVGNNDLQQEKLTNLDTLEETTEDHNNANAADTTSSGWSNLFFNSKASKFAV